MRFFSIVACVTLLSCGGSQRSRPSQTLEFDPELYEVCLIEGRSPTERVCTYQTDGSGHAVWGFPLGETSEFAHMKEMWDSPDPAVVRHLASGLIARPRSFVCNGSEVACAKLRQQVACEAEVARTSLIRMRIEDGDGAGALKLVADVIRAGSAHYRHEDVPCFLEDLKALLPSAVIAICLAEYEPTERDDVFTESHWRPYTEDDPAPSW